MVFNPICLWPKHHAFLDFLSWEILKRQPEYAPQHTICYNTKSMLSLYISRLVTPASPSTAQHDQIVPLDFGQWESFSASANRGETIGDLQNAIFT